MNLMEKFAPEANKLSIKQYCPPRSFELAGKKFKFVLDTGEETGEYDIDFIDNYKLKWSFRGSEPKEETYELRKADEIIYLLSFCVSGLVPRRNDTFVIDLEQMLVTYLRASAGENPCYPYVINTHFGFGYIAEEGKEHADRRRHGFTGDVVGTAVGWRYGHQNASVHVYYDPSWYRIGYELGLEDKPHGTGKLRELTKAMPSSDEPCDYVKINDWMYLVSVTEQNMEKILGPNFMGFRSNTLCFLDNYHHLYSVGRGFGTVTSGEKERELFVMIGKIGRPVEVSEKYYTDPNPYMV
jgi:hypothetical protein